MRRNGILSILSGWILPGRMNRSPNGRAGPAGRPTPWSSGTGAVPSAEVLDVRRKANEVDSLLRIVRPVPLQPPLRVLLVWPAVRAGARPRSRATASTADVPFLRRWHEPARQGWIKLLELSALSRISSGKEKRRCGSVDAVMPVRAVAGRVPGLCSPGRHVVTYTETGRRPSPLPGKVVPRSSPQGASTQTDSPRRGRSIVRGCGGEHWHGAGEEFGSGDGGRVPHCTPAPPCRQYILREVKGETDGETA